ncbi:hypothetical protein H5410_038209 [Solanum commersonii]|uniref:Uncharacterized protein n=1 Tax=Solanum commersonii TaxID=4109 RepID=A0A9J5Y9F6_SOLCO|nr:hypothetical protein H5410_038209 [Solanum commersonii]
MLNTDSDVLNLLNGLKGADFVGVYVVHPISVPLVVEEILVLPSTNADVSSSLQQDNVDVYSSPHKNRVDLSSSPQIDKADVSLSQSFDENKNKDLNQNQSSLVEEQSPAPRVEEQFDSNSLYDVDKNIDDLNIYKEKRGRFKGNLGGDDPYFDSSDPGSDISEDEGDLVENDEVVDPTPRKKSTKIYFDPTAKKGLHLALIDVLQNAEIRWCARHIWANWKDNCEVKFNGNLGIEIHDPPYKHVVDLKNKVVESFVDHWYKKETYLKTYNRFIQPMTNMKMWPKSDRPVIEPPEITTMPGRPGKNRRKDSDEPVKKKFGKATRKGRKMKCSVCKTFGHNKKGCPSLKNVAAGTIVASVASAASAAGTNAAISNVVAGTSVASASTVENAATSDFTNAAIRSQSSVNAGPSAGCTPSDSGNTDRVLHSATLSSSTPTNIDIGYKPNGLRWKGRAAITQR